MNTKLHTACPPDPSVSEEDFFAGLSGDEDYWDYLDALEVELGGHREWDNPIAGGAQ